MSRATLTAAVRHVRALAAGRDANDPTDGDLLRAFASAGDGDAFAVLVKRHAPLVLGVCRRALQRLRDRLARRGVAVSAVLAAVALARPADAAVPSRLAASTVSAAVGGSAAAGTISPSVAALVKGAKGIMMLTRTKAILLGVLTAGLLAGSL